MILVLASASKKQVYKLLYINVPQSDTIYIWHAALHSSAASKPVKDCLCKWTLYRSVISQLSSSSNCLYRQLTGIVMKVDSVMW